MSQSSLKQSIIDTLPPETSRLLVAVSGGVDSVVLLHALRSVSAQLEVVLEVAHLDHQIRPESTGDADFVRDLCHQWELPCHIEICAVPALAARDKISLEMAGRNARREFLQRVSQQINADQTVLAHHRDDQVETLMLRLLRGSGPTGLAAMRVQQNAWWRPLLGCSRKQILDYASQHGLNWVEDSSNCNPLFLRNRLRIQVLPQLMEINPQFPGRIAELTRQFQQDNDYWQEQVGENFPSLLVSDDNGLRLNIAALLEVHPALRIRLIREGLRQVRGDLQRIESLHLAAIEDLLAAPRSQSQIDLPGCWVARRYQTLWIREAAPELPKPFDLPLPLPGELELPDGQVLRVSLQSEQEGESLKSTEYSLADVVLPLRVRSWSVGDRFAPAGMVGHKRLKHFFADNHVESEARLKTPLLVGGGEILWVVGMRRSRHAVAGHDRGLTLRIELL